MSTARNIGTTGRMSQRLIDKARTDKITNVFFFCHGWKGDMPAAKDQYEKLDQGLRDLRGSQQGKRPFPNFRPLFIGLHWPSQPLGDEELSAASFGAGGARLGPEGCCKPISNGWAIARRSALRSRSSSMKRAATASRRATAARHEAYSDLNDALGLKSEGVGAPPDADREEFDPDDSYEAGNEKTDSFGGGINLGGLLGPLRQLSYWTMKKRAAPSAKAACTTFSRICRTRLRTSTRIHLMGHSFGTIVVSGMLGGPDARGTLPRPVDSVVLVQGAVSLWCYAADIPLTAPAPGYFSRILADGKVRGPIVTTQSKHDNAVGTLYPLASRIKGSAGFAGTFPNMARSVRSVCRACPKFAQRAYDAGRRQAYSSIAARSTTSKARNSSLTRTA